MKAHKLTEAQLNAIEKMGDMGVADRFSKWMALPPVNGRTLAVLEREGYVQRRESDGMWRLTMRGVTAYQAIQADKAAKVAPEFLASLAASGIEAVIIPTHHVTSTPRQMTNGDTAYTAECEHGWTTGFHNTAEDAEAVALGHGDVSRPLYIAMEGGPSGIDPMTDRRVWWAGGTYVVQGWDATERRNLVRCIGVDDARHVEMVGKTFWTDRPMSQYVAWGEARVINVAEVPVEPFRAVKGKAKISRRSRNRW